MRRATMWARETAGVFREALVQWWRGGSTRLGAALAYYTVFSLAPLLVIAIAVAGAIFGGDAARGMVSAQLQSLLGAAGATAVEAMVERASIQHDAGALATGVAFVTMMLGASGAFGQLQTALNEVWGAAPPRRGSLWRIVRRRLLSFGMVLAIGFLLLVSLLVAALVSALDGYVVRSLPAVKPLLEVLQLAVSIGLATLLFAAIFKVLPDCPIRWSDVWVGAVATALLFEVGRTAIALYLARSGVASLYGAAGSIVLVLLWVYYSSQILFLGAEFTQVWSRRRRPLTPLRRLERRPPPGAELRLLPSRSTSPRSKM